MAMTRHGFRIGDRVKWAGYTWEVMGFLQGEGIMLKDVETPAITRTVPAYQLNAPA